MVEVWIVPELASVDHLSVFVEPMSWGGVEYVVPLSAQSAC